MSTPTFVFANPRHAIIDYLAARKLKLYPTDPDDLSVGSWFPKSNTETPKLPYLAVGWDGTPLVEHPVHQRSAIRLTVWHDDPSPAEDILGRALGLLYDHPGDARVWNVLPGAGPSGAIKDPDTGKQLATATVRVSTRSNAIE